MKVTINIDCTPEEARTFFGQPDLKPMQGRLLTELEEQMKNNLHAMDPDALFKTWLPAGIQGLEQLQKAFWAQFTGGEK
ncbi:DUF6489 family protein [Magnetospira thiophila]